MFKFETFDLITLTFDLVDPKLMWWYNYTAVFVNGVGRGWGIGIGCLGVVVYLTYVNIALKHVPKK
mgnify:CR=1 FL=1